MKLNYDCIRDLLLTIEEKADDSSFDSSEIEEFATEYGYELNVVIYHIQRLKEAEFIEATISYGSNEIYNYYIDYITWDGHQFIDAIRPKTVWETTTKVSKELGVSTISSLSQIASNVVSQIISKYLGY